MSDVSRLRSEGDLNTSPRRERWQAAALDAETRALLEVAVALARKLADLAPVVSQSKGTSGRAVAPAPPA